MVLVWLNESKVGCIVIESVLVVESEAATFDWVHVGDSRVVEPIIASFLCFSPDSPDEFDDRVVEGEVHSDLCGGGLDLMALYLLDENFETIGGEEVSFDGIKVDVGGEKVSLKIGCGEATSGFAIDNLNDFSFLGRFGGDDEVF